MLCPSHDCSWISHEYLHPTWGDALHWCFFRGLSHQPDMLLFDIPIISIIPIIQSWSPAVAWWTPPCGRGMLRCGWCGLYLFKQAALSEEYPEETWREMEGFNMTQLIAEVSNLVSYSISILENKAKYMVHLSDSLADVWPWAPPDWMTWFEMRITYQNGGVSIRNQAIAGSRESTFWMG